MVYKSKETLYNPIVRKCILKPLFAYTKIDSSTREVPIVLANDKTYDGFLYGKVEIKFNYPHQLYFNLTCGAIKKTGFAKNDESKLYLKVQVESSFI